MHHPTPSQHARNAFLGARWRAFIRCAMGPAAFLHFEVDAPALEERVPFALDAREGRTYASLVAVAMRRPQVAGCGSLAERLTSLAQRRCDLFFLNLRTYVRVQEQPGVHFIAQWISSRVATVLGRRLLGLPQRFAAVRLEHDASGDALEVAVREPESGLRLSWSASSAGSAPFSPAPPNTLDEFLLERYLAFSERSGQRRCMPLWHDPWPQASIEVAFSDLALIESTAPWLAGHRPVAAHYSPGVEEAWIGGMRRF